ncbi:hypothetical protein [Bacillus sp. B-jedd]|uniref:hypothetical protein n=1 Tax=Bacillus sp. B-jedd TaxID=1476857 RepID=UPI00051560BC|nr:hypothetical protein [Bacillus sp. B-jedd]CEG27516.1 hypothetical protein BN1002_02383 [Bacillus sp. B-jedd]
MNISDYFFESAEAYLNSSLLFLFPASLFMAANILFGNPKLMVFILPFLVVSFIFFQLHLAKVRAGAKTDFRYLSQPGSLFQTTKILPLYENKLKPGLLLFSPEGLKLGEMKKIFTDEFRAYHHVYELRDENLLAKACYGLRSERIDVFRAHGDYIGCLYKEGKQWLVEAAGQPGTARIESSPLFMDVKVISKINKVECRLRRGYMPVEVSSIFQNANSPILDFENNVTEEEKLIFFAMLLKEFFMDR